MFTRLIVTWLLILAGPAVFAGGTDFRAMLEKKYERAFARYQEIVVGPTTKILWYDWETNWWASFSVVETDERGELQYFYECGEDEMPSEQSLDSIKVEQLNGEKLIFICGYTHMGNGSLYVYRPGKRKLEKLLEARVFRNFSTRYEPKQADVRIIDVDKDGDMDVVIQAKLVSNDNESDIKEGEKMGEYYREFLAEKEYGSSVFVYRENLNRQKGVD